MGVSCLVLICNVVLKVLFKFCYHLAEEERFGCFTFYCVLDVVWLSRGDVGRSVACGCDIFWQYSLTHLLFAISNIIIWGSERIVNVSFHYSALFKPSSKIF